MRPLRALALPQRDGAVRRPEPDRDTAAPERALQATGALAGRVLELAQRADQSVVDADVDVTVDLLGELERDAPVARHQRHAFLADVVELAVDGAVRGGRIDRAAVLLEVDLPIRGARDQLAARAVRVDARVRGVDVDVAHHVVDAHRAVARLEAHGGAHPRKAHPAVRGRHLHAHRAGRVDLEVGTTAMRPAAGQLDLDVEHAAGVLAGEHADRARELSGLLLGARARRLVDEDLDVGAVLAHHHGAAVGIVDADRAARGRGEAQPLVRLRALVPGQAREQRTQEAAEAAVLFGTAAVFACVIVVVLHRRSPEAPRRRTWWIRRGSTPPPGPASESVAARVSSLSYGFTSITRPPPRSTAKGNSAAGKTVAVVPITSMQSQPSTAA